MLDGGAVYVTPATNGGICEDDGKTGGCDPARRAMIDVGMGDTPNKQDCYRFWLSAGHVNAKPGSTLRLEFSDGSSTDIALTWVGPPISAGFFSAMTIPAGKRMTALVLRKPSGAILAKETELFQVDINHLPCRPDSSANAKSRTR